MGDMTPETAFWFVVCALALLLLASAVDSRLERRRRARAARALMVEAEGHRPLPTGTRGGTAK